MPHSNQAASTSSNNANPASLDIEFKGSKMKTKLQPTQTKYYVISVISRSQRDPQDVVMLNTSDAEILKLLPLETGAHIELQIVHESTLILMLF